MIAHSDALLEYYRGTVRDLGQFVKIYIYRGSNLLYTVTDEALVQGSLIISRKAVSSSTFRIGEAYVNEAKFGVIDSVLKLSSSITGCTVKIFTGVQMDGFTESFQVFQGTIQPNSVTRRIASVEVSCDGVLCKFDQPLDSTQVNGTPYELLKYCCDICGVELAISKADFESISENSFYTLYIVPGSNLRVYRDVLLHIAQIMCGFFTDTPDGKLTFKSYQASADKFSLNIDTVSKSEYGDGVVSADGMTWYLDGEEKYIAGDTSSEYVIALEQNPLVENLTTDVVRIIGENIWSKLSSLSMRYLTISYNGCPLLELGDIIEVAEKDISVFLTSLTWVYHGKSSIESLAIDQRVNTVSQAVKSAAGTGGGGGVSGGLDVLRFINVKDIELSSHWSVVAETYFSMPASTVPYMDFVAVINVGASGLVEAKLTYDQIDQLLTYQWHLGAGYFTLSLSKSFDASDVDRAHILRVSLKFTLDEGQSGVVTLAPYGLEMNLLASKLVSATPDWTGLFEITETAPMFKMFGGMRLATVEDAVSVSVDKAPVYVQFKYSAIEFTLSGTAVLRYNKSALDGYDLDYVGTFPDNGATIEFTAPVTKEYIVVIHAASNDNRQINVYLDGAAVAENIVINSGDWGVGKEVTACRVNIAEGSHVFGLGRGSTSYSPLVDYVILKYEEG